LRKKLLISLVVFLVLLLGGGSAAAFMVMKGKSSHAVSSPSELQANQFSLTDMTTNLADGTTVIQVSFTLQGENSKVKAEMELRKDQIADSINEILHSLTKDQLQRPQGQDMLKSLVLQKVNAMLTTGRITAVYIPAIVYQ
jgi:flagellar FliL protein